MSKTLNKKHEQPEPAGTENAVTEIADGGPGGLDPSAADAPENSATSGVDEASELEDLRKQLAEARATAGEHWDTVLRTRAEIENLRKRSQRDLENAHKFGVDRFISEMLPVKDSLELGLAASRGSEVEIGSVREGMELTLKMFANALDKLGVVEINPEGESFDPEFHQAMTMQEAEGQASGTVISVIQKGYSLNQRLVRPALVVVAK